MRRTVLMVVAVAAAAMAQVVPAPPLPVGTTPTPVPMTIVLPTIIIRPANSTGNNHTGPFDTRLYFDEPYHKYIGAPTSPQAEGFAWHLLVALITPPIPVVPDKIVVVPGDPGIVAIVTVKTKQSADNIVGKVNVYDVSFTYEGVTFFALTSPPPHPVSPLGLSLGQITGIIVGVFVLIFALLGVLSHAQNRKRARAELPPRPPNFIFTTINGDDSGSPWDSSPMTDDDDLALLLPPAMPPPLGAAGSEGSAPTPAASAPTPAASTPATAAGLPAWNSDELSAFMEDWLPNAKELDDLAADLPALALDMDSAALSSLPSTSPSLCGSTPLTGGTQAPASLVWSEPSPSVTSGSDASAAYRPSGAAPVLLDARAPALFVAVQQQDTATLLALLTSGASPDARNAHGQTLLMAAACSDRHLATLKLLLEQGADSNLADADGWTALTYAARYGVMDAVVALLGAKCNPTVRDSRDMTPLMHAAAHNHDRVVDRLLRVRAPLINAQDRNGWTALHWAAASNACPAARFLLEYARVSVRTTSKNDETALHVAARHGHLDMVRLLTSGKPADTKWLVQATATNMLTAEDCARARNFAHIAQLLAQLRATKTASGGGGGGGMRRAPTDEPPAKLVKREDT